MSRPTETELAAYLEEWGRDSAADPTLRRLLAVSPAMAEFFREQYVAGAFLAARLRAMGLSESQIEGECFTFGRACFGNRDVWAVLDTMLTRAERLTGRDEESIRRASTPLDQGVPEPTRLLRDFFAYARGLVGDKGVFPQPFVHTSGDAVTMEALALNGTQAFDTAVARLADHPDEFAIGIDLSALPGQGTRYSDFLLVFWGVNGRIYTGVIDYQCAGAAPEPAFHDISWSNNYWNNTTRSPGERIAIAPLAEAWGRG